MKSLALDDNYGTYQALAKSYSEKHRYYHTYKHVEACLNHLDKTTDLAKNPEQIELAIWFHDAIYKPTSKNNELESAQWADDFLKQNKVTKKIKNNIYHLIMATLHNGKLKTNDQKLLVDIDLTILGSRPEIYDVFEKNIREEYKWVPKFIFRKKRKDILKSFLAKDYIFNHKYFIEKFENQARINLNSWVNKL